MASRALENRVALITGGARGLGFAVSRKFSDLGAGLVITGTPGDAVPEAAQMINDFGGRAVGFIGDVGVESQAEACVHFAQETYDQIDILVHLYSVTPVEREVDSLRISDFDHTVYTDLRSIFLVTHFALPFLRESHGVILSPGAEKNGELEMNPVLGAAHAWMEAFNRGVALQNKKWGVRAHSILKSRSSPLEEVADAYASYAIGPTTDDFKKNLGLYRQSADLDL